VGNSLENLRDLPAAEMCQRAQSLIAPLRWCSASPSIALTA
jgi:hypothetical protein